MEGLSRLITSAKRSGNISGLKIMEHFDLTHLLFVDDILIFINGSVRDTTSLNEILHLFYSATGREINRGKSIISLSGCTNQETQRAIQKFPFQETNLLEGIKYLGFRLKLDGYKIENWTWLITKIEKRINCWHHRLLSKAGRLTLIKSVLEATPVYSMSLAWIPRGILHRIQQICNRFLWNGNKKGKIFAWVKWAKIATPKKWGGWGLKSLPAVAQALDAKQGWLLIKQNNLWAYVIHHKYIWPLTITDWIRRQNWNRQGISGIWRAILNAMPIIRDCLLWHIGNGNLAWLNEQHWNLPIEWNEDWKRYIQALTETHIRLRAEEDELIWALAKTSQYSPKLGYIKIIDDKKQDIHISWWVSLWKLNAPPRTRLLMWNILENKAPTGSNLKKRAFSGPSRCVLCLQAEESTQHLFLSCPTTRTIWAQVILSLNLNVDWQGVDISTAWEQWWISVAAEKPRNLPVLVS
eukprot:PITA_31496